jgi:hypothetical protein
MTDEKRVRPRVEQKWVVLLNDGRVVGTENGGPLTRDAAWLLERWYTENHPEIEATAKKLTPKPEDA